MLDLENIPPRLKRTEASIYLMRRHGISRTPGTLAVLGGGPSFRKVGSRTVLYDVEALEAWALTLPRLLGQLAISRLIWLRWQSNSA